MHCTVLIVIYYIKTHGIFRLFTSYMTLDITVAIRFLVIFHMDVNC